MWPEQSASQGERLGCEGRQGKGQLLQSLAGTEAFLGMSLEPRKGSQQERNLTFRRLERAPSGGRLGEQTEGGQDGRGELSAGENSEWSRCAEGGRTRVVTVTGAKSVGILGHFEGQTNGSDGMHEITPLPARYERRKRNKTGFLSLNVVLQGKGSVLQAC